MRVTCSVRLTKLWRSSTFRLALVYIALLSVSVLVVFAFIYWATIGYMSRQIEAVIAEDLNSLAERYRLNGLNALIAAVNERATQDRSGYTLYALALPDGPKLLAGNLKRWPPHAGKAWVEFDIDDYIARGYNDDGDARARIAVLTGGELLLVGRDIDDLKEQRELIGNALLSGLAITGLLGLLGAVMISFGPVRKIETINKTSQAIMRGDLSRRIPLAGKDNDIDQLAANLNRMLDQIQSLMENVRHTSNDIAHDLRTPLTRLRARLESLCELQAEPEHRAALTECIAETDSLLATFNALLRIAQIEGGAAHGEFATVDLVVVVRDAVDLYEPLASDKGQRLDVLLARGAAISIAGDRDLLFQALVNLLDNAIKYTHAGDCIEIDLKVLANAVEIVVADNGPGIPAPAREHVLRRFYRLEAHRSDPGNGLGLSLVAAVAKLHRGRLELADNNPGLRVSLILPSHGESTRLAPESQPRG